MNDVKYFGFSGLDGVREAFSVSARDVFPAEEELLLALYEYEDYSGSAFVLFQKDGVLYEVNGSHCSCYGLEDCWSPEETSWEALRMRPALSTAEMEARLRYAELLAYCGEPMSAPRKEPAHKYTGRRAMALTGG